MTCTKEQLIQAINSYAAARQTSDPGLLEFAGKNLQQHINSLEFSKDGVEPEVVEN